MKFSCAVALAALLLASVCQGTALRRRAGRLAAIARSYADPDLARRGPRCAVRPGAGNQRRGGGDQRDPAYDDGLCP